MGNIADCYVEQQNDLIGKQDTPPRVLELPDLGNLRDFDEEEENGG